MKTLDLLQEVQQSELITERQINLLKCRLNNSEEMDLSPIYDNEIYLTEEQTTKGLYFLLNLWKTPTGKERLNCPFGTIEKAKLETFENFTFEGFYNAGRYNIPNYVPIYSVNSKNGSFEYYYFNGELNIIG